MFCRKCGTDIGNSNFCPNCGENQSFHCVMPSNVNRFKLNEPDMSIGDWIITFLISIIPIVGLIMLIIWAVSSSAEKQSRKTWAAAQLIIMIAAVIIFTVIFVLLGISGKFNFKYP